MLYSNPKTIRGDEYERFKAGFFLIIIILLWLTVCFSPSGDIPAKKRSAILAMHDEPFSRLYNQRTIARDVVRKAAGYAVFSNVNGQSLFSVEGVAKVWPLIGLPGRKPVRRWPGLTSCWASG